MRMLAGGAKPRRSGQQILGVPRMLRHKSGRTIGSASEACLDEGRGANSPMAPQVIDIRSTGPFPAGVLSNFAPNAFLFCGMPVASMEGLLQSFKSRDSIEQRRICSLVGVQAKRSGRRLEWREDWGPALARRTFARDGQEWQILHSGDPVGACGTAPRC